MKLWKLALLAAVPLTSAAAAGASTLYDYTEVSSTGTTVATFTYDAPTIITNQGFTPNTCSGNVSSGSTCDYVSVTTEPANSTLSYLGGSGFEEFTFAANAFNHPGNNYSTGATGANAGGTADIAQSSISAAPEPSTWALMLAGVALLGLALRRQRNYHALMAAYASWLR